MDPIQPLRRKREERFCQVLIREMQSREGGLCDEAMVNAVLESFGADSRLSDEKIEARALRRAKMLLRKGEVRERLGGIFELGNFTTMDAVHLHVAHMRGTAPAGANYQALRDYEKMVWPETPKTPNVNKNLNYNVDAKEMFDRMEAPPMGARILGKPKVSDEQ